MKQIILIFILICLFVMGCCQPEGDYEECLNNGYSLCIDFYPKCESTEDI